MEIMEATEALHDPQLLRVLPLVPLIDHQLVPLIDSLPVFLVVLVVDHLLLRDHQPELQIVLRIINRVLHALQPQTTEDLRDEHGAVQVVVE